MEKFILLERLTKVLTTFKSPAQEYGVLALMLTGLTSD